MAFVAARDLTCKYLLAYYPGHGPGVQGARGSHAATAARSLVPGERADAGSALRGDPSDAPGDHAAPRGAGRGSSGECHVARTGEAPLPESRPDPRDLRPLGEKVRATRPPGTRSTQATAGRRKP